MFGVSAWNVRLEGELQSNLIITPDDEFPVEVDNLDVAQFICLLLNNEKVRSVIDTITSKVGLILGRFPPGRKAVLDAIRHELRKCNYSPILFDFEKPPARTSRGQYLRWQPAGVDRSAQDVKSKCAKVAELADAPDLGSGGETHGGSTPPFRTNSLGLI